MTRDYYAVLGVPRDADTETIRKAYRKLAREHHPDRGGDPQRSKEINEAHGVLSDPIKRAEYDRSVEDILAQLILGDPIKSESDDHFGPQDTGRRADTRRRIRPVVDTRGRLGAPKFTLGQLVARAALVAFAASKMATKMR